jgi:hypothetical protein
LKGLEQFLEDDQPIWTPQTGVDIAQTPSSADDSQRNVPPIRSHSASPSKDELIGAPLPTAPEMLTHLYDPLQDIQPFPSSSPAGIAPSVAAPSSSFTCHCCYEEFPLSGNTSTETKIVCDPNRPNATAHSFCAKCVRLYLEEWLFGTATVILRPRKDDIDGPTMAVPCLFGKCLKGGFPDSELHKALPTKIMEKLTQKITPLRTNEESDEYRLLELAVRLSIQQQEKQERLARMRQEQMNLSFSGLKMDLLSVGVPAREDTSTSTLPISSSDSSNPQRRKELSNKNKASDQNQDQYEKSLHEVEEAMSQAKFRTCPRCSTKFLKDEDFCNKLKCPSCATAICYICRNVVPSKGYDHFCKHSRGGCGDCEGKFCALWTDVAQDNERDQVEMRECGLETANRLWAESLLEDTSGAHSEIRVDVDKLLEKPTPSI